MGREANVQKDRKVWATGEAFFGSAKELKEEVEFSFAAKSLSSIKGKKLTITKIDEKEE